MSAAIDGGSLSLIVEPSRSAMTAIAAASSRVTRTTTGSNYIRRLVLG